MIEGVARGGISQVHLGRGCEELVLKVIAIAMAALLVSGIVAIAMSAPPLAFTGTYYMYPYPTYYYPIFF